jgi:cytochrome c oxidase subunit 1
MQTVPLSETMSSNLPSDFEDNPVGLEAHSKWVIANTPNEEVK